MPKSTHDHPNQNFQRVPNGCHQVACCYPHAQYFDLRTFWRIPLHIDRSWRWTWDLDSILQSCQSVWQEIVQEFRSRFIHRHSRFHIIQVVECIKNTHDSLLDLWFIHQTYRHVPCSYHAIYFLQNLSKKWIIFLLLMAEILHQLRLLVFPIIYRVSYIPGG